MEEIEYKDNEKVLYKTRCKPILPNREPEEVDCFVTEGHVLIEAEEPIKIPIERIKRCYITGGYISESHTAEAPEPLPGTATLTFLDDQNKKQKLSLGITIGDLHSFKTAIDKEIAGRPIDEAEKSRRKRRRVIILSAIVIIVVLIVRFVVIEGFAGIGISCTTSSSPVIESWLNEGLVESATLVNHSIPSEDYGSFKALEVRAVVKHGTIEDESGAESLCNLLVQDISTSVPEDTDVVVITLCEVTKQGDAEHWDMRIKLYEVAGRKQLDEDAKQLLLMGCKCW